MLALFLLVAPADLPTTFPGIEGRITVLIARTEDEITVDGNLAPARGPDQRQGLRDLTCLGGEGLGPRPETAPRCHRAAQPKGPALNGER